MNWIEEMTEAMSNGVPAFDYLHQKRQERANPNGQVIWEALQNSSKNRPETMTIKIETTGVPVDPYYYGEE